MAIISISVDDETLKAADDAVEKMGMRNRSELFRRGVENILSEVRQSEDLPKNADAVLIAMHDEDAEDEITHIKHGYEKITVMQTHTHVGKDKCLEIFVLKGDGKKMSEFSQELFSNRKIRYSRLVRTD
ncbi:MAG: CopG family ribbon-helix-helix protein [Candidatus Micrarchaeia archaeon]|jgi:CopG family nickel-responsive transcriptional regulator